MRKIYTRVEINIYTLNIEIYCQKRGVMVCFFVEINTVDINNINTGNTVDKMLLDY